MIAPAKLNLSLLLGPTRPDGLHEICSLFIPISLADELSVDEAGGGADEVVCPGMPEPDLTARALSALREAGWKRAPLRIEVDKRIPVAAGLGGGSADAAAVLRLAADAFEPEELAAIAATLGADVPSQIDPRFALVGGAGEQVTPLPEPEPFAVVLLPDREGLSTAATYAEADRRGVARSADELAEARGRLAGAAATGASPLSYRDLLVNDLAAPATSLRPSIDVALEALRESGAEVAIVTGSGPTAVGLFADTEAAERAATELLASGRDATVATSRIDG